MGTVLSSPAACTAPPSFTLRFLPLAMPSTHPPHQGSQDASHFKVTSKSWSHLGFT
jgi:hypothetical protein